MRIAVFGGRFDPIHNGHLAVAQEVLQTNSADEVWLSIENQHQWRPIVATWQERKKMVELAIESVISNERERSPEISRFARNDIGKKLKIDLTPIELRGMTETIQVMRTLTKKYPHNKFVFVVGSDQLPTFPKWSHWQELQQEVHFLMIARKGSPVQNIPKNVTVIEDEKYIPLDDSATRIRELIEMGKSIHDLVPENVEAYIREHKLYQ